MNYYFCKTLTDTTVESAIEKVSESLKDQGFGIISEIDISKTLKKKIDIDFKEYRILGACNPHFAYKALLSEDMIGLFLPCNIVVIDQGKGKIDVAAIDPIASMAAVENKDLEGFAIKVKNSLVLAIENI